MVQDKKKFSFCLILATFGVFLFACAAFFIIESRESEDDPKPVESTKQISSLTYSQVVSHRNNDTDLQWGEYAKSITGQRVRWTLYVYDVNDQVVACNYQGTCDRSFRVYFDLPKEERLQLDRNQRITFEGDIVEVGIYTDILKLGNVVIIN